MYNVYIKNINMLSSSQPNLQHTYVREKGPHHTFCRFIYIHMCVVCTRYFPFQSIRYICCSSVFFCYFGFISNDTQNRQWHLNGVDSTTKQPCDCQFWLANVLTSPHRFSISHAMLCLLCCCCAYIFVFVFVCFTNQNRQSLLHKLFAKTYCSVC